MTASEALNGYITSLPTEQKAGFIRSLLCDLEITPSILSNWRYGRSKIKLVYRREISKLIGRDIFVESID